MTDAVSVNAAFDNIAAHFGGVDIVVSNAGAAWQGRIGEVGEDVLRKSFELNFYGYQRVAQAAVKIMLAQGTGGCLESYSLNIQILDRATHTPAFKELSVQMVVYGIRLLLMEKFGVTFPPS